MIWALCIGGLLLAVALVVLAISFSYSRRRYPPMSAEELKQDGLDARDRLELHDARLKHQDDLRTSAVQALVGVAVLAGAFLAYQAATADRGLTRQGQASERFTRAIDQLGNDRRREAQIGGIYGLEQIARQSPDENRLAVTEVLVAYLHRRAAPPSPAQPSPAQAEYHATATPTSKPPSPFSDAANLPPLILLWTSQNLPLPARACTARTCTARTCTARSCTTRTSATRT